MTDWAIASIPEILQELGQGRMVIMADDEDRENEGDLVMAAQCVTPQAVNFMARYGRGLICLTLDPIRAAYLQLAPMAQRNESRFQTAFTVSIEAREGVTTGISAQDRAHTLQTAIAPQTKPEDIVTPGHIFPIVARPGGVLERRGHTEASVDLAQMAGMCPAGVICEILKEDGSMARMPDLKLFARQHGLKIGTVADLVRYRQENEGLTRWEADSGAVRAVCGR